ncbi:MAG: hypothetical protein ACRDGM_02825, partial [bacterium]
MKSYLVGCVVLLGLAAAGMAGSPLEQDNAIAAIKNLGGAIEVDEKQPGKLVVKVDLHGTKVTDADLALLTPLTG